MTKHHGFGNDFLVALVDAVPPGASHLARRLCERHRGIGADGLIFGLPPASGASADVEFRLFNSDGTEAEVSGNGLRCLGQALLRARRVGGSEPVTVSTAAGHRRLRIDGRIDDIEVAVAVEMGAVRAGPEVHAARVATALANVAPATRRWGSFDIGNPHIVVEVDEPSAIDLGVAGPAIEAVTGPINAHFIRAAGTAIEMVVWERGAGITEACGSGACAVAVAARGWALVSADTLEVSMPGGVAVVTVGAGDVVTLAGPSVFIADIDVPDLARYEAGGIR